MAAAGRLEKEMKMASGITAPKAMRMYWSSRSPYCRKVMVVAHELNVADRLHVERVVVGSAIPNEEVMAHNPLNKIPTIILEDGTTYSDSPVISELLDLWYGEGSLFPKEPADRIAALRWQALGDGFMDLLIQRLAEVMRPAELRSQKHLASYEKKIAAVLGRLELEVAALERAAFSIGHISIGCALGHLAFRFPDIKWMDGHPQLARWYSAFAARPSAKATEYEDKYV